MIQKYYKFSFWYNFGEGEKKFYHTNHEYVRTFYNPETNLLVFEYGKEWSYTVTTLNVQRIYNLTYYQ